MRSNNKDYKLLSKNQSRVSYNNLIEQSVIKQMVGEEPYKKTSNN